MSAANPKPFPLHWPAGVDRTRVHDACRFKRRSIGQSLAILGDELDRMGARQVVLSTSLQLRMDGSPRANSYPVDNEHGVAVYFRRRDEAHVIACDNFGHIADNLIAISKTIEALRAIERYGSANLGNQAFSAFRALPAAGETAKVRDWREVLDVPDDLDPEGQLLLAEARYKKIVKATHPDRRDGDADVLAEANGAISRAREELA